MRTIAHVRELQDHVVKTQETKVEEIEYVEVAVKSNVDSIACQRNLASFRVSQLHMRAAGSAQGALFSC